MPEKGMKEYPHFDDTPSEGSTQGVHKGGAGYGADNSGGHVHQDSTGEGTTHNPGGRRKY